MVVLREYFPNCGTASVQTTLAGSVSAAAGTITINTPPAGFGTAPGQLPSDESVQWRALIDSEIMLVPGGTTLTKAVTRAAEGGSPTTHAAGAGVRAVVTGAGLDRMLTIRNSAGSVVGNTRDLVFTGGILSYDSALNRATVSASGVVYGGTADIQAVGSVASAGTAESQLRSDHVHPIGSGTPDGTKFLRDDRVWAAVPASHDPVTLAASADTLLDLSTQELSLAAQVANRVLAGPTSGTSDAPTFRALVASDVPDISATYLTPVKHGTTDHTGLPGVGSGAGSAHVILGTVHTDSNASASPTEGDTIVYRSSAWTSEASIDISDDDADITAVNLTEQGTAVAAPGSGHTVVFAQSGGLYTRRNGAAARGPLLDEAAHDLLDHTGLTGVGGTAEGTVSVATDAIWDAAGDLVQGTGSNTAARLAIGAAYQVPRANAGGTAVEYAGGKTLYNEVNLSGGAAGSVNWSSIPATGKHLIVEGMLRGAKAAGYDDLYLQVNGDAGNNYDKQQASFYQTTHSIVEGIAASAMGLGQGPAASATAGLFSYVRLYVPYYADTNLRKILEAEVTHVTQNATGGLVVGQSMAAWRSTAAVNQLTLFFAGGSVAQYSRASLYIVT